MNEARNNRIVSKFIGILIALAMVMPASMIFSGQATAESTDAIAESIPEMPPIPPYTIYGIICDETGLPVSEATVTITNLRTGESLKADVYENGAYEGILEDLPSRYAVNDNIEISVVTGLTTTSKTIVVEQMGFGERVDIYFGNDDNNAGSKNILATNNKIQSNPVESSIMHDEPPSSLNSDPVKIEENPDPIIIDPMITSSDNEPVAEITLVDMRAPPYFRLAFTEKENDLRFSLRNDGEERVIVIVDLYHVEPDGITESFLKTVHFGMLLPGKEKFRNVFGDEEGWIPTERGRNWIRGEIYVKGHGHERALVNEFKESFNVVPGWRPVMHIPGDWVIDEPTVIENKTIIVDGHVYINADSVMNNGTLFAGDFIVSADETIGAGFEVDLWCNSSGEFKVEVKPNATLNVYGNITNNPDNFHYWFYMNGTLLVGQDPLAPFEPPGTIENTHGSPDLSQPGGI